ncbi:hypothetical protein [Flavobacterium sp.]|uniref:hypothetical protein n=1 Tax=Flavobacterium sp. TaxID=239 RepID=UPI00286DE1F6|nr:hypothetical protein [Flavobacterium sp.]
MKTNFFMLAFAFSVVLISCSKDDNDNNATAFTSEETITNSKIDMENDDLSKIVDEQLTVQDGIGARVAIPSTSFLPVGCATVVRNPTSGFPSVGGIITKTITFDTAGCTMPNGNILKGKIIISIPYQPNATSHIITCTFENFYHNQRKVEGTKIFTRTMTVETPNSPSHPILSMEMNLTITLADGRILTRNGTRTTEIIAGYDTSEWNDNVYSVTGSWQTSYPNLSIKTTTITSPIILKFSCIADNKSIFSQGVITFSRNNRIASLNYGDGSCDNLATFSINGNSYEIILGN